MELSNQMVLLAKVVESKSFSAAARALNQSPSAVSKQIAQLEERVGVRLLNRSKHGLSLTQEGNAFYERCADIAARISEAETYAASINTRPEGQLNIVSTVAFGKAQLLKTLPGFLSCYPDVRIAIELTDRKIDLAAEGIDLAIRFSEQIDDNSVVARKIAPNRRLLCAAPSYLEQFGTPTQIGDVAGHNCLQLSTVSRWNDWNLVDPDTQDRVELNGNFVANSADGIYHAALAGLGLARLSEYLIGGDLEAGRLVHILPEYRDQSSDILAIYSDRKNLPLKVRAFIDYLVECFGPVPPWEREDAAA